MQKKLRLFITIIFFFTALPFMIFSQDVIRITNGEWPPYLSEDLKYYGLASRIVEEAFKLEGIRVEWSFFPWKRSFDLAKFGEWHASAIWFHSPEREEDFYLGGPVLMFSHVFFYLKEKQFSWNSVADLARYSIDATIEYDYGQEFMEAEKSGKIKVDWVVSDEMNFTKLFADRIDIFPCDVEVGFSMLHKNFSPEEVALIDFHPKAVRHEPGYLLFSKRLEENKFFLEVFNRGLEKLKASGRYYEFVRESRVGLYIK